MFNRIFFFIISIVIVTQASAIKGGGATLSAPLYYSWSYYFYKDTNKAVFYDSIGSFAGINKLKIDAIDFASSDKMVDDRSLFKESLFQLPIISTYIDIVYNLKGVDNLKLSYDILTDIFLGKIEYWDDKRISAINKDIPLPHKSINVILRSDNSGTTYNFTKFLSKYDKRWRDNIGVVKCIKSKYALKAKGNQNISQKVKETDYSISYLPRPYTISNKLSAISFENKIKVNNYIIFQKKKVESNKDFLEFLKWVLKSGDKISKELGYFPLNKKEKEKILLEIKNLGKNDG
jgi:phosphate transport system substrate-binding protein